MCAASKALVEKIANAIHSERARHIYFAEKALLASVCHTASLNVVI
jgi:hypothetical protein